MRRFDARHLRMLDLLAERPRGTNDLAIALAIDVSTASRLANEAVKRGFAVRQSNPEDLRAVSFSLTDAGRAIRRSARTLASKLEGAS